MANLPRPEVPLVFLDVETTGFKPEEGHEIIEVAGQRVRDGRVTDSFHAFVTPSRQLTPDAIAVHGLTMEQLEREGRPASEVIPAVVAFCGTDILVGHNIGFDLGFLNAHLRRLGLPMMRNGTLDTLELSQQLLILPSYSLDRVAAFLKVPQPAAHRAMPDVETTRQVYLKLLERFTRRVGP